VVVGLGWLAGGRPGDFADYTQDAATFAHPSGVLGTHLAIASLTLIVWLLYRLVHRRPLPWLWSVSPGIRWRYVLACLLVSLVVFGALAAWTALTGPGWNPPRNWGWYLAILLVTTPFQALGEEVLFRGYLMQTCGMVVRKPWFAIGATAVVFALFHGTQDIWLFTGRLVFGLAAGALVWRTGGLEAGIVAHVVNNLAAFLVALFSGTLVQTRTMTTVPLEDAFLDTGVFIVVAAACWLIARAMRVPRVVAESPPAAG
jgi:membrane protease YdiL (CAAX protease family)